MTMYLPNTDIRPTGYEPAEFIEPPDVVVADPVPTTTETVAQDDADGEALVP